MAADPQAPEAPLWHAALRRSDDDAHRREEDWARLHAVEALELRLAQANADRHALREAVAVRDRLLEEHRQALRERDRLIVALERASARREDEKLKAPTTFLVRVWRFGRRLGGRAYRRLRR